MSNGLVARLRRVASRAAGRLGVQGPTATRKLREQLAAARVQRDAQAAELSSLRDSRDGLMEHLAYLFVVTYGRSGSTLLQGILSSTPGVVIRGENGAVLQDLFRFHDTVTGHRERLRRPDPLPPSHPWWGVDGYRDETAFRDMRLLMLETVLRPDPDTRVVGFKEIYWMPERMPDYLAFVRNVFPGARFILNTRDLDEVAASKWWARNPNARQELQDMEKRYVEALDALGENAYRVHYNEYVADPTVLRGLFDWLGEQYDAERVRAVMAVPHSY